MTRNIVSLIAKYIRNTLLALVRNVLFEKTISINELPNKPIAIATSVNIIFNTLTVWRTCREVSIRLLVSFVISSIFLLVLYY